MNGFLRLFVPKRCLACRRVIDADADGFCDACIEIVATLDGEAQMLGELDGLQTLFSYSGAVAHVLKRFKSTEDKEATDWFCEKLAEKADPASFDVIVCVPRAVKGYNQSRALAKNLAKRLHKPFVEALIKNQGVKSQTKCRTFTERIENVRRAYRPNRAVDLKGKRVLIVDDIYTSGATLGRCSDALRKLGAVEVYGITVAHRSRDKSRNIPFELLQNISPTVRRYTVSPEETERSAMRYKLYRRTLRLKDRILREFED